LQIFGSRSGISHLLHAPTADPNKTAIRTVQILRIKNLRWRLSPEGEGGNRSGPTKAGTREADTGEAVPVGALNEPGNPSSC
jgi:hypothetical protein